MGVANDFGGLDANGFLLNMNSLFEQFIARRLRRLLSHEGIVVQAQQSFDFDERGHAKIRPDLIIQSPRGRRVVADTKYKDKSNPEPGDLYQMLAYCRVLRVPRGVLITSGRRPSRSYMVCDGDSQIDVVAVDLDGTISDVDASIDQLAAFLRTQIT